MGVVSALTFHVPGGLGEKKGRREEKKKRESRAETPVRGVLVGPSVKINSWIYMGV